MDTLLRRPIGLGVRADATAAQTRRVQTVNLVALGSIFLNLLYLVFIVAVDVDAFIVPAITNTVAILLSAVVLKLNRDYRIGAATLVSFTTAVFNLGLDGYFFGLRHVYRFEERGVVDIKGKGPMPTYFLVGPA